MTKVDNLNNHKVIGGWLYLVAIGLVAKLFFTTSHLSKLISLSENFQFFPLSQKALFWGEAQFLVVILLISAYVAFLFVKKRRDFSKWYIGVLLL